MRLPKKGILVLGTDRDSSRNYMSKIADAVDALDIKPGQQWEAEVRHDDDCPAIKGGGYCACDPDVAIRLLGGDDEA